MGIHLAITPMKTDYLHGYHQEDTTKLALVWGVSTHAGGGIWKACQDVSSASGILGRYLWELANTTKSKRDPTRYTKTQISAHCKHTSQLPYQGECELRNFQNCQSGWALGLGAEMLLGMLASPTGSWIHFLLTYILTGRSGGSNNEVPAVHGRLRLSSQPPASSWPTFDLGDIWGKS